MKRRTWVLGMLVLATGCAEAKPAAQEAPATTAQVERGALSSMVSLPGTLTHRARPDGSPWLAVNQAHGIYTKLPEAGDRVGCGDVLYRVDDDPVLLLCGTVPAYRDLRVGDRGKDVRQLNRSLRGVDGNVFTATTAKALGRRALDLGDAVVLPRPARIAKVAAELGEPARPGAPVVEATSTALEVQVNLDATQQRVVRMGDRARITLPGVAAVDGTVDRIGTVAATDEDGGGATFSASIRLDDPKQARGLEQAPVQVDITTEGVEGVLSVPVTALVGKAGGGFAVEVVGERELVAVQLGLFDTAGGRVEVSGPLDEGDRVVVPSP